MPRRLAWLALGALAMASSTLGTAAAASPTAHSHVDTAEPVPAGPAQGSGQTRRYFIAADVVKWNYAPTGRNAYTGKAFGDAENTFVGRGRHRIGSTYYKSLYREYTDQSFSTVKDRPTDEQYLGDLGPIIRAEVGDTIIVEFKNNTPFPASIHPHGVFYDKKSEGAPYADKTSGADHNDDAVPSKKTHTYVWQVPERAGPGPADGSSVMWMYHSHTDETADVYAGLMGPMIITRKGMARADGSPTDVDRELIVNFEVDDENQSPWLDRNIRSFARDRRGVDTEADDFVESNLMHSMNGLVYGNLPGLTMKVGEHVRWYLMGMGTEVDLHTPHWHGNTATVMGMRTDVVSLLPAQMVTADMTPDDPGVWAFHCHVADHIAAGMLATYEVSA